jgi:hypothetical protein
VPRRALSFVSPILLCVASAACDPGHESGASAGEKTAAESNEDREAKAKAMVEAFVDHLRAGENEKAYALMSTAYRRGVSLERFAQGVAANPYLSGCERFSCASLVGSKGRWYEFDRCSLKHDAGSVGAEVWLEVENDEELHLAGISIAGMPVLPSPGEPK